jgi:hypothetical protein
MPVLVIMDGKPRRLRDMLKIEKGKNQRAIDFVPTTV